MDLLQRISGKIAPAYSQFPTSDKKGRPLSWSKGILVSASVFLRKPIRLRGNSSISIPLGVILLFPLFILLLIALIFVKHPAASEKLVTPPGAPTAVRKISEKYDKVFVTGCEVPDTSKPRANAAFVVLARNKELDGVVQSMKSIERHFNRWYNYPYVFLDDDNFNETFKKVVQSYTKAKVEFGKIDPEMWNFPDWVDPKIAREGIAKQGDNAIMYGGMESYHSMCRFYSGWFFRHELLAKYEWYWRLEPDIKYFCDITYDPFLKMIEHNKTYGFTIAVKELRETVPNLFRYASAYMRLNNLTSKGLWEMFTNPLDPKKQEKTKLTGIPDEVLRSNPDHGHLPHIDIENMEGESYNMCHFWSNFEIARLDWFRSKEYSDFFEMLDHSGGFWMERWGDAPVHSLAAGALLNVSDIHYFRDFGYRHTTIQHCPANAPNKQLPREPFLEKTTLDERARKEEDDYWEHWDAEVENGVGCRCRCDTDIVDIEGKEGSCIAEWVDVAGGWAS